MSTSSVNSSSSSSSSSSTNPTGTNAFDSLNVQDFINMLVAELQNQDPTQPVDNSEILNEVSQIRSIESNDQLTTTLQSVLLGQNVATGGSLINQTITGTDAAGNSVTGQVSSISIANGTVTLNLSDNDTITLSNVTGVSPSGTKSGS
jgi:flagellar basal-body rod modification protein FlgD